MEAVIPVWFETGATIVMVLVIAADLVLAYRRPHIPSPRESGLWVGLYVALALVFAALLWAIGDASHAGEFIAGWLTEYSLSIDNLFVFVIIMARFSVPRELQQEVLMVGIIIALVLRGLFILLGAALIANFAWIFYLFGAFLLYTAVHQALTSHREMEESESAVIRLLRRRIHITDQFDGVRLRTTVNGKRAFTPAIVVFIALGTTDLLFALDSIPAIFGITQNPFLVFAANVFALMGLRQLFFLLGALIDKLAYLSYGIAAVLLFIGIKLIAHALHTNEVPFINGGEHVEWAPEIGTVESLAVIIVSMGVATGASLIKLRRDRIRASDG
ncbi:TerC/Alx family metal homeostasis membrane protein [Galbitalea soli]|uniref:TerC/Alx family metal homeostasis membrane protein n=1 Tax=Galbitalea soli TaxID=1268042 RepID=A0A7C9PNA7_9MICO|nr:TerC/Alx family metal homeostasis membrane protein [Galbitalea soli]